jgi:hypothetical protein
VVHAPLRAVVDVDEPICSQPGFVETPRDRFFRHADHLPK